MWKCLGGKGETGQATEETTTKTVHPRPATSSVTHATQHNKRIVIEPLVRGSSYQSTKGLRNSPVPAIWSCIPTQKE